MIVEKVQARKELQRFLKFSVVGVIGAVVDFGTFNILANWIGINSLLASVFSFSAAVTSNFIWNRFWTYPDSRSKPMSQQILQFAIVSAIGLAIRTPIFALSETPLIELTENLLPQVGLLRIPLIAAYDATVIGRNLALALAIVIVLFWNFGINRIWTYSDAGK
ncbi:MAG: GtrA family protein [Anaerolineales bacterium]|jgi:putative flippase GtrA